MIFDPECHDIWLILTRGDERVYEFQALGVRDIIYEEDPIEVAWRGGERLRVVVSGTEEFRLTVKPHISIRFAPRSLSPDRFPVGS